MKTATTTRVRHGFPSVPAWVASGDEDTFQNRPQPVARTRPLPFPSQSSPYGTQPRKMGLKPGLDINFVQELMALADGEDAR